MIPLQRRWVVQRKNTCSTIRRFINNNEAGHLNAHTLGGQEVSNGGRAKEPRQ